MRKRRALIDLTIFQRHHPQVSLEGLKELPDNADIPEIRVEIEKALENAQDYLRDECGRFIQKLYYGGASK